MKRTFAMGGFLAILMLSLCTMGFAQRTANYAGTWELDKAKSQLPGPMGDMIKSLTWTITQDEKQLTREQKMERAEGAGGPPGGGGGGGGRGGMMGGGGPLTLKLDGSETTVENPRGVSKTKATMTGGALEVNTVMNMTTPNGDMTMTNKEKWELLDGGKTLKVHQTRETPRGPMESTMVFTKK
ncbi:MAG: hypothetical protein SF339_22305 [Blastocatellia bacterium]|nr:hypothetical protein [Blastocatellia bacterium]